MGDPKDRIRIFLEKTFPTTRNIAEAAPLLGSGHIDSLGILEVVTFLEKEFEITVADEELLPDNFGSIKSLCAFVDKKSAITGER
jgi:acyl carrier protein